jgi:hypothetical protein
MIDSRGTELSDCKVSVTSTSGQDIPVTLETMDGGKFKADFLPFEVGKNNIHISYLCKIAKILIVIQL